MATNEDMAKVAAAIKETSVERPEEVLVRAARLIEVVSDAAPRDRVTMAALYVMATAGMKFILRAEEKREGNGDHEATDPEVGGGTSGFQH